MATKTRNIRIGDDLWEQATQRAAADEMSVSQLIRRWLRQYVNGQMPTAPISDGLLKGPAVTLDDGITPVAVDLATGSTYRAEDTAPQ